MSVLEKSASMFRGYDGVKGGMKAAAAFAAGRWLYNKWQSNRANSSSRDSAATII